ncbi:MAG: hypothetical protein KME28_04360 [Pelatocladus maniniholoensis HA4357-MV3]|jgi:hypothetical protein|uniref:Uncharacterized protein n=1 Tax=Pelatocladus maniniholoensis HA4357-MV3 TaxID=1117104 RepID=A0A9E3H5I1_9NOST|nr:hypothetical protein [Pelatocladus maniniholoensis HA4357-MV3]
MNKKWLVRSLVTIGSVGTLSIPITLAINYNPNAKAPIPSEGKSTTTDIAQEPSPTNTQEKVSTSNPNLTNRGYSNNARPVNKVDIQPNGVSGENPIVGNQAENITIDNRNRHNTVDNRNQTEDVICGNGKYISGSSCVHNGDNHINGTTNVK